MARQLETVLARTGGGASPSLEAILRQTAPDPAPIQPTPDVWSAFDVPYALA